MQGKFLVHSISLFFLSSVLLFSQELQEGTALYQSACLSAFQEQEKQALQAYTKATFLLSEQERGVAISGEQWRECAEGLRLAIQLHPDSREIMDRLFRVRYASDTAQELLDDVQLALEKNPASPLMTVLQSKFLALSGKDEEAEKLLATYLEKNVPWPWEPLLEYYLLLTRTGKLPDADGVLAQAMESPELRDSLDLQLGVAEALLQRRPSTTEDESELKNRLLKQVELIKSLGYPRLYKEWSFFARYADVLENLELWSDLQELLDDGRLASSIRKSVKWMGLNWKSLQGLERKAQLKAVLEEALPELSELDDEVVGDFVSVCLEEGLLSWAATGQELLYFRHPENIPIRIDLAKIYLLEDSPRRGLTILHGLEDKLPPLGLNILAFLHSQNRQYAKACQDMERLEKMLQGHPEGRQALDADFYLRYAVYAEDAGMLDLALDKLKWAHEQFPESHEIWNSYGYILADHNLELPFACTLIEKAVAAQPDNQAYLDSLAWVYYRLKRYQEALQIVQKILPKYPSEHDDGTLAEHIGAIFQACGYERLGRTFWQEAWPVSEGAAKENIRKFLDETAATSPTEK